MKSCLYEGWLHHVRYRPVANAFRYSMFMVYLDLAELDTVFRGRWFWSTRGPNLAWFRRADHLGAPSVPLETAVRDLVQARTGKRPSGPIRALCNLRYFGHTFNPASFYYCYDAADTQVDSTVVEIHNTPWGEVYCYVLDRARQEGTPEQQRFRFRKEFHVSPFIAMDVEYDWGFSEPGGSLQVHMLDLDRAGTLFEAHLRLARREISGPSLTRVLWRYPLLTVQVVAGIYWQALRLWVKGAPFHTHPSKRAEEQ